jgi:hypothetical protein
VAAYARDETGGLIQSPPRPVTIVVPPPRADTPHGSHGAPPFYTGTDADFLEPAGEPHFASLRKATYAVQQAYTNQRIINNPPAVITTGNVFRARQSSSTHRDEVLAELQGFDSHTVQKVLDDLDSDFQFLLFPRSGLYTVHCGATVLIQGEETVSLPDDCTPSEALLTLEYVDIVWENIQMDEFGQQHETFTASIRSSFTYFIPRAPEGKLVQSAKLRLGVWVTAPGFLGPPAEPEGAHCHRPGTMY